MPGEKLTTKKNSCSCQITKRVGWPKRLCRDDLNIHPARNAFSQTKREGDRPLLVPCNPMIIPIFAPVRARVYLSVIAAWGYTHDKKETKNQWAPLSWERNGSGTFLSVTGYVKNTIGSVTELTPNGKSSLGRFRFHCHSIPQHPIRLPSLKNSWTWGEELKPGPGRLVSARTCIIVDAANFTGAWVPGQGQRQVKGGQHSTANWQKRSEAYEDGKVSPRLTRKNKPHETLLKPTIQ
jgi:hypothetical protein